MAVGVEFEYRYNEEETKTFTEAERKKCSTSTGGANVLGFAEFEADATTCNDKFTEDAFEESSILKRSRYRSFGTIPKGGNLSDWAEGALEQLAAGTIGPLPFTQTLKPIYDLLDTKAVKEIKRDGTDKSINAENVFKAAIKCN